MSMPYTDDEPAVTAGHRAPGDDRITQAPVETPPLHRFEGGISRDASTPFDAGPGRSRLCSGWSCAWAQRTLITRSRAGSHDIVTRSGIDVGAQFGHLAQSAIETFGEPGAELPGPEEVSGREGLARADAR